jgi:hypothetical protein
VLLQELVEKYLRKSSACKRTGVYEETNQVRIGNLVGLWIILGGAAAFASVIALARRYLHIDAFVRVKCGGRNIMKNLSCVPSLSRPVGGTKDLETSVDLPMPPRPSPPPPLSSRIVPAMYGGASLLQTVLVAAVAHDI